VYRRASADSTSPLRKHCQRQPQHRNRDCPNSSHSSTMPLSSLHIERCAFPATGFKTHSSQYPIIAMYKLPFRGRFTPRSQYSALAFPCTSIDL
jgi:hypothetical protein